MYGEFPRNLHEKRVDTEQSYRWLKFIDVKGDIEGRVVATKGEVIGRTYFKNKLLNEVIDRRC
jgi:hypothetical protein